MATESISPATFPTGARKGLPGGDRPPGPAVKLLGGLEKRQGTEQPEKHRTITTGQCPTVADTLSSSTDCGTRPLM